MTDINGHKLIPGVYTHQTKEYMQITQHGTHHYGRLEPFGFAMSVDRQDTPEDLEKKDARIPNVIKTQPDWMSSFPF